MWSQISALAALFFFALSLKFWRISQHTQAEEGAGRSFVAFRLTNALAWLSVASYASLDASKYMRSGEEFDAVMTLFFVAFSALVCFLLATRFSQSERTFFTLTKVALLASVVYFSFAEILALKNALIYANTYAVSSLLNALNIPTYTEYPAYIYSKSATFHEIYKPIEIILACTAIQSVALFAGLTLGVSAPARRRVKAFLVSVPTILALNLLRNVFVCAAYFLNLFGSTPIDSFDIAHNIIARIFVLFSLILIAYAVFIFLPEALNFVDNFLKLVFRPSSIKSSE